MMQIEKMLHNGLLRWEQMSKNGSSKPAEENTAVSKNTGVI